MADVFWEVVGELNEVEAVYFAVYMESMAAHESLEIPAQFTSRTGWPGKDDCAIVTSVTHLNEWPVQFKRTGDTARSVGTGWGKFLRAHQIRAGQLLVFEVVDERILVAAAYPRDDTSAFGEPLRPLYPRNDTAMFKKPVNPIQQGTMKSSTLCSTTTFERTMQQVVTNTGSSTPNATTTVLEQSVRAARLDHQHSDNVVNYGTFTKKLKHSHCANTKSSRLDIPVKFWRRVGEEKFDEVPYELRGPRLSMAVTTQVKVTPAQTVCYFGAGWTEFRRLNHFQLNNVIFFTQVGKAAFNVTKLAN